jgi:hypothetical protein
MLSIALFPSAALLLAVCFFIHENHLSYSAANPSS